MFSRLNGFRNLWRFKLIRRHAALLRALSVISMVGVLATSATYAALQSQQVSLTANTIQTATAGLLIGTASATSTAFSGTHLGFTFQNIVPGATPAPGDGSVFYLKNNGTATLGLKMAVSSTPTNPANVDLSKVSVTVTRVDTNTTQTLSLQALADGYPTGGLSLTDTLAPASTGTAYRISVSMAANAFSGSSATIGGLDFVFSGTAVN